MAGSVDLVEGFLISLQAVLKLLLIAFAGVLLEKCGYMDSKLRSGVAKMIYYCLLPCLLFTAIASNADLDLLKSVYLLVVFGITVPSVGVLMGLGIARLMPSTSNFGWRQAVSCMGLGNSGYLPLVFVPAVMLMNPFGNTPDQGEAKSEMLSRLSELGLSYVSTYLIGYVPTFWLFGRRFLIYPYQHENDSETISTMTPEEKMEEGPCSPLNNEMMEEDQFISINYEGDIEDNGPSGAHKASLEIPERSLYQFPTIGGRSIYRLTRSSSQKILKAVHQSKSIRSQIWRFFTTHTTELTCIFSACFGLTPLKSILFSNAGEDMAYLEPTITNAMRSLGSAVSPVVTILLGANVLAARKKTANQKGSNLPKSIVAVCLTGKLIILPVIGTLLVYLFKLAGILSHDPVLLFVILLQFSPPSAQNLTLMCELANHGQNEISTVLFYMYLSAVVTMTAWTTFDIYFINSVLMKM